MAPGRPFPLKSFALALAGLLVLAATPLALTAGPFDRWSGRGGPSVDTPPFQALEPCKYGPVAGEVLFQDDFEDGAEGWTKFSSVSRPNLWHWTTFPGNNTAGDPLFHGGPGRLYYGIENAFGGTFNTDPVENRGEIRSPPVSVPSGTVLVGLNTKWHVEWDRPTIYDGMMFGYVNEAGQRTLLCFFGPWMGHAAEPGIGYYVNSPTGATVITGCKPYRNHHPLCNDWDPELNQALTFDLAPLTNLWEPRFIPLPAGLAGQTVRFTFYFQEGDALINDATGWMVDDVQVVKVG